MYTVYIQREYTIRGENYGTVNVRNIEGRSGFDGRIGIRKKLDRKIYFAKEINYGDRYLVSVNKKRC